MNFLGSVITFATRFPSWGRRCPGCSELLQTSRGVLVRIHQTLKVFPGMAAGVTERLWEIGDIVDVLEAWERVRVGHVVLSTKVQYYLERAEHCERMAALTSNREVRANFAELAQQWRDLARQHQNLGNPPPQSN
jgi:hypothetical protein